MNHKKILVICPSPFRYAPAQRLKYEQYLKFWEKNGYEIAVKLFISDALQKVVYIYKHYFTKVIESCKSYRRRLGDISEITKNSSNLWIIVF